MEKTNAGKSLKKKKKVQCGKPRHENEYTEERTIISIVYIYIHVHSHHQ